MKVMLFSLCLALMGCQTAGKFFKGVGDGMSKPTSKPVQAKPTTCNTTGGYSALTVCN